MTLREIKITGLYGYVNKHIRFHDDINLLVGINGSGKTSVLNVLSWMLTPSLPELCLTQFKEISLKITLRRIDYELLCRRKVRRLFYYVSRKKGKTAPFHPLVIVLSHPKDAALDRPDVKKKLIEMYGGLTPTEKEVRTLTFLEELPKAVVLGLDRTVSRPAKESRMLRRQAPASSVDQIQDLANTHYNIYQSRLVELNNKLKDEIILSAFDVRRLSHSSKTAPVSLSEIDLWRTRVTKYLAQSPKAKSGVQRSVREAARHYFDKLKTLSTAPSETAPRVWGLGSEFQQMQQLVAHLEKLERGSEQAYAPVKSYLDTLNKFFRDCSKQILFKEDTNQICFQILDKTDRAVGNVRSIELLSSGERQLLTLFTFIKFSVGGVFVIDEPELSLHPKWQENFLEAIKALMPRDTQLVVATHSPAIVGKNRNYCITLLPYNE